ncbi:MAG: leucine-rich repeat domain-containing protein [Cytophagaceae bacterium]|jgi:tetratricopeptide (TPR) repeat protein|nr:leucine-rich repeat domain-containing protein [Cytophagaceae bacterium]
MLRRAGLITSLLLLSSFGQPDAKTYYESAIASLNKKEYIQAISEFTNAISLKPDYADAYFQRATAKELLGKKMGFMSTELCSDLVSALVHGKLEALDKIESTCIRECYDLDGAFLEPEIVYCADFSSKILSDLPAGSDKFTNIVKLNLFNNRFKSINDNIGKLNKLISLDLSSNSISSVSPEIGKLIFLKELNLSKNQLSTLPYEFGNLKKLKMLNLRLNGLTSFPKSVANLNNLETLDLALNKLTSLPIEISGLKNLKTLILVGNEISGSEQKKIKALLPNTTIYFE